jgi:hypothetical protein
LLVRDMRKRMELESEGDPSVEGGRVGRRGLLRPRPRPRPGGRREGGERRELGVGVIVVGGPGVRLIVWLLASMMRDVTCWGER